jgi:hypothetical protein
VPAFYKDWEMDIILLVEKSKNINKKEPAMA